MSYNSHPISDEDLNHDDRIKISDATRARMQAKGLEFPVPDGKLVVIMQDDIKHTKDFPICDEESCCCHRFEYERYLEEAQQEKQQKRGRKSKTLLEKNYERAPLNGNQGFQLLR